MVLFVVFLCVFESVAFEVHIDDDGVMHEPVDHRGGGHRVLEGLHREESRCNGSPRTNSLRSSGINAHSYENKRLYGRIVDAKLLPENTPFGGLNAVERIVFVGYPNGLCH